MPRIVAADWDRSEVRVVVAESRRGKGQILHVAAAPLAPLEESDASPQQIGRALRAALGDCPLGRGASLVVAVDRASLDLSQLTLPPARDEELPELVRLQLLREPHAADEPAAIDFVPLDDEPAGPRKVLAVSLSAAREAHIRAVGEAAGLSPARILARPYLAASLLARARSQTTESILLVAPAGDEVDLAVVAAGRVAYWRSVRMPRDADEDAVAEYLATEVARTLAADAQARPDAPPVAGVVALGAADEHEALGQLIRQELHLDLITIGTLSAAGCEHIALARQGRFAATLGAALDEADRKKPLVDLLHPRRAPKRHDRRRMLALAGGLACAGLVWLASVAWDATAELDDRIDGLKQRRAQLDGQLKQAAAERETAQALADWSNAHVSWLDELRELSLRLPGERDTLLGRMSMNATAAGGQMELAGIVRDPALVARIESALRDATHEVHSNRVQERRDARSSTWQFESSVFVAPRGLTTRTGPTDERRNRQP